MLGMIDKSLMDALILDWTTLQLTAYFAALYPALLGASVIDWRSHQIPNSLVIFISLALATAAALLASRWMLDPAQVAQSQRPTTQGLMIASRDLGVGAPDHRRARVGERL